MARIQPIDPATANLTVAEQLDGTRKALGATPNLFLTAAQSPAAITALNSFFGALARGALGAKVGERIALAVAQQNGCDYCLSAHSALGAMHGVSADEVRAARHGRSAEPKPAAALTFALALVTARGRVDDSVISTARASGLSDGEMIEVVAHVALNIFTNYLNNVAQTDVDFPYVSALDA